MQLYSCMKPLHVSVSGGLHVDKPMWIGKTCYMSISLISCKSSNETMNAAGSEEKAKVFSYIHCWL